MRKVFQSSVSIFTLSVLVSCFPQAKTPNTVTPSATPQTTAARVTPNPEQPTQVTPTAVSVTAESIQSILTSSALSLRVNEELMLIGDLKLSSGRLVTFDDLQNLLQFENQTPSLLQLDSANRLIRALKAGKATVVISSRQNPTIKVPVTVDIEALPPEVGPNEALVDLEIQ